MNLELYSKGYILLTFQEEMQKIKYHIFNSALYKNILNPKNVSVHAYTAFKSNLIIIQEKCLKNKSAFRQFDNLVLKSQHR